MQKIKIQCLKNFQGPYIITIFAKLEFNCVRLSWFSTKKAFFLGPQNKNLSQISADFKIKIQLLTIFQEPYFTLFA